MDWEPGAIEVYETAAPYTGPERRRYDRRTGVLNVTFVGSVGDERRQIERRQVIAPTPREDLLKIARTVLYKHDD